MPGGGLEPRGAKRRARTVVGRGLVRISAEKLAVSRKDWRTVSVADVHVDVADLVNQLVPSLHIGAIGGPDEAAAFGETLVAQCRRGLSALLPFGDAERAFLDLLLDKGEIDATVLISDRSLQERIQAQPLLAWKALNVRRHKG